jgi:hypothetical protein
MVYQTSAMLLVCLLKSNTISKLIKGPMQMDELDQIRKLAGITEFNGYQPYGGSNISLTGMEKRQLEKKHNIQPGTDEWFRLWFTLPYLTNTSPLDPKFK